MGLVDLLLLAHNRRDFTRATVAALALNTDWSMVRRVLLYDDNSTDGAREFLETIQFPVETIYRFGTFGAPVNVMNHYLSGIDPRGGDIFAKVDSDTIVPPGWLGEALTVMHANPDASLLGIEAMRPAHAGPTRRRFLPADFVGGIGLMRQGHFVTLPRPDGRFGFTAWQQKSPWVQAGWIDPALPVFLLDRLPFEPWRGLSREYVARGWQREWAPYTEAERDLWAWWL